MSRYDLAATHVVNKFLWSRLSADFGMSKSQYHDLVPIIPTQQVPIFNDLPSGRPFIVYNYINVGYSDDFYTDTEQVSYRIYGDKEGQLRNIHHYIVDLFKRYDWAAQEINNYVSSMATTDGDEHAFDFKYTTVVMATSPEPTTEEGGRQVAMATVRINYTHETQGIPGQINQGMRA